MEYVRVCSSYGANYFYSPGTDRCANSAALPYRAQTEYGTVTNQAGSNATGYGVNSYANGDNSVALGNNAYSGGDPFSASPGSANFFNGYAPGSAFSNQNTTAIGTSSRAGATGPGQANATAIGANATANVANGTAVGQGASVSGLNASAFGQGAQATAAGSVAIGQGSIADQQNTVSVGAVGAERRIVNVAPGNVAAGSTDAVNGSQLYSLQTTQSGLVNGTAGAFQANNAAGAPAPSATGANAVAGGFGANASASNTTAIGAGAQATMGGATALGAGAIASGDPTTAVGNNAAATGDEASAFGAFSTASGTNSTALGRSATAAGTNSVAVGEGASATQANSVAIGAGVTTTRANQVAIGNAGQTYTFAGLNSAQSQAAQSGPTRFVTSDSGGNLATSNYGPSSIAAMDGRINTLATGLSSLKTEARRGIAAVAATAPILMPSMPGKTTVAFKASGYRGEIGAGLSVAHRLNTPMPIVLFGNYSNGGGNENVIAGGAGVEF